MILNHLLAYTEEYYINEEDLLVKVVDKSILPEDVVKFSGVMGAKSLIKKIIDENPEKPESTFLNNNMDSILIENVVVVPPDFRPCGTTETGTKVIDDVNKFYIRLVTQSNHLKNSLLSIEKCDDIYKDNFKYIQFLVISLYDYILEKMSKKTGLIRSNILGKRVDFSGRAVISPNPDLNLDECNIPYMMLLELLKPQLSSYLIKRRVCKRYNQAVKIIEDCIKEESDELYELAKEFCKGKVCVLNRQPTLHRMGILGFKMGIHLGKTIQIHPLVCPPLNADFDGDAVAVYVPVTEESKQDIIDKIGVWNNLISPTDCTLLTSPNQDIILGIHSLTK
jgi:DNA-directed RNA polymerase subunit beta'